MNRRTLNSINSGPSGGKTTLYGQALQAHLYNQEFFVPGLTFPEGRIAICQTDRGYSGYQKTFIALGLDNHPKIDILNFVDDRELHRLTRPAAKSTGDLHQLENLRDAISARLRGRDIGTLILDLYDDFHLGGGNGRKACYDGRTNLQWAQDLDVAILAVLYPFKQTSQKRALRVQDRQSGVLQLQASFGWKFTIIDAEESKLPYWTITGRPAPGEGSGSEVLAVRGNEEEGDTIGLFRLYDGKPVPTITEIIDIYKVGTTKAYTIQKQLAAGEDPDLVG